MPKTIACCAEFLFETTLLHNNCYIVIMKGRAHSPPSAIKVGGGGGEKDGGLLSTPPRSLNRRRSSATPTHSKGWSATGKDAALLAEYRSSLIKAGFEDVAKGIPICALRTNDATLLRFLIARKRVVKDAVEMFAGAVEWRKKVNFEDQIRKFRAFRAGKCDDPSYAYAEKFFYGGRWGASLTGGPVGVERIGTFDVAGLRKGGPFAEEIITRAYTLYIHSLFDHVCTLDRKPQGDGDAILIIDGRGVGMPHMRNYKAIIKLAQLVQNVFPEFVRRVYAINMPRIARGLWKLVRVFLPAETQAKVNILGANAKMKKVVLESVAEEAFDVIVYALGSRNGWIKGATKTAPPVAVRTLFGPVRYFGMCEKMPKKDKVDIEYKAFSERYMANAARAGSSASVVSMLPAATKVVKDPKNPPAANNNSISTRANSDSTATDVEEFETASESSAAIAEAIKAPMPFEQVTPPSSPVRK